jgi:hypothetical protein
MARKQKVIERVLKHTEKSLAEYLILKSANEDTHLERYDRLIQSAIKAETEQVMSLEKERRELLEEKENNEKDDKTDAKAKEKTQKMLSKKLADLDEFYNDIELAAEYSNPNAAENCVFLGLIPSRLTTDLLNSKKYRTFVRQVAAQSFMKIIATIPFNEGSSQWRGSWEPLENGEVGNYGDKKPTANQLSDVQKLLNFDDPCLRMQLLRYLLDARSPFRKELIGNTDLRPNNQSPNNQSGSTQDAEFTMTDSFPAAPDSHKKAVAAFQKWFKAKDFERNREFKQGISVNSAEVNLRLRLMSRINEQTASEIKINGRSAGAQNPYEVNLLEGFDRNILAAMLEAFLPSVVGIDLGLFYRILAGNRECLGGRWREFAFVPVSKKYVA